MNYLLKLIELAKEIFPGISQHAPKYLTALSLTIVFMQVITVRADTSLPIIRTPKVNVRGFSGKTIPFFTTDSSNSEGSLTKSLSLPHLVLLRNGKLTEPYERTLIIEISGLDLPPSGASISIEVSTQHADVVQDQATQERIVIWQETRRISSSSSVLRSDETIAFRHEFRERLVSKGSITSTPTDYFKINIRITNDKYPITRPLYQFNQEYAFLMENQWLASLPEVLEDSPGAAPDDLIVYYCDMFTFPTIESNLESRLPRGSINKYLQTELIPAMIEAFRVESQEWGFPWYEEWHNYRSDEPSKRLSVALTGNGLWYHGKAPDIGHARISFNLQSVENENYHNMTESIMSNFYHELFHNLQRNINLKMGGSGDIDGIENAWQYFSEGTAVLASSVGQPDVQFSSSPGLRSYLINANGYLAGGGHVVRDIYKNLQEINPYHSTMYWRFLYEQCGGMKQGTENPAAGMQIIRNTLDILYSSEIVDIQKSSNLVEHLPAIMNESLKRTPNCPFANYKDSLNQFAKAIYSLKLENGRCLKPGHPKGCGFYDPEGLYLDILIPHFEYSSLLLSGEKTSLNHSGDIPNLGIRYLEIEVHPSIDGRSFNLELISESGFESSLHLQIIKLIDQDNGSSPRQFSDHAIQPAVNSLSGGNEKLNFSIPQIYLHAYDRLGLIITRLDNGETSGDPSEYTLHIY